MPRTRKASRSRDPRRPDASAIGLRNYPLISPKTPRRIFLFENWRASLKWIQGDPSLLAGIPALVRVAAWGGGFPINRRPHAMKRAWTVIGVSNVVDSFKWYQSLFGQPPTHPEHDYFGQILDADVTVLLCLHQWGAHEHPSLMSRDQAMPGYGLLLFLRVDDFDASSCAAECSRLPPQSRQFSESVHRTSSRDARRSSCSPNPLG
jgi:hypothetical protein